MKLCQKNSHWEVIQEIHIMGFYKNTHYDVIPEKYTL